MFTDVELIIQLLDGLPLALSQAGSYLGETNMTVSDYLKSYKDLWADLMKKQDKFLLQEYGYRSILTTWMMSYNQVRTQSEEAANFLKLWAFLDSRDVWYELVACAAELDSSMRPPEWLLRMAKNRLEFFDVMRLLSRYSLADARTEAASFSMHSVLHEWCYQLCEDNEDIELFRVSSSLVAMMVPSENDRQFWVLMKRLLPHGSRVYELFVEKVSVKAEESAKLDLPGWVFNELGTLFADQRKLAEGEKMFKLAAVHETKLEPDSSCFPNAMMGLGRLYHEGGKVDEAEKMWKRALAGYEKALEPDHPQTLMVVQNLGLLYHGRGKFEEAEKMWKRALTGYEKALEPDHPQTLAVVQNLGMLYHGRGNVEEAEKMWKRALAGYEKALEPDHPDTLRVVQNLGLLYHGRGKFEEAEKMLKRAMEGYRNYGRSKEREFSDTAYNLGNIYEETLLFDKAEAAFECAVRGYETLLGPDDPETLEAITRLTSLRKKRNISRQTGWTKILRQIF